jgi:hypothetical protein
VLEPSGQVSKLVVIEAVGLDLLVEINIGLSDLEAVCININNYIRFLYSNKFIFKTELIVRASFYAFDQKSESRKLYALFASERVKLDSNNASTIL